MADETTKTDPPGVSDITPGVGQPDMTALQKRIQELETNEKNWSSKEGQYIEALNRLAEKLPQDRSEPAEDDEVDPEIMKAAQKLVAPLQAQLSSQGDQLDQSVFMQMAAATGITPEQVGEAERQYRQWRESGLQTVDARGTRRTPTRQEALDFILGKSMRAGMMKEAPTKNMQQLRQQLLGDAAFGAGESRAPRTRAGASYEEIEKLSLSERLKKREEILDAEGF